MNSFFYCMKNDIKLFLRDVILSCEYFQLDMSHCLIPSRLYNLQSLTPLKYLHTHCIVSMSYYTLCTLEAVVHQVG